MSMLSVIYIASTGLVAAGLTSSGWAAATGEPLQPAMLLARDALLPARVLALVVALPLLLGDAALEWIREQPDRVLFSGVAVAAAAVWCFVEGVVIVAAAMRIAEALA